MPILVTTFLCLTSFPSFRPESLRAVFKLLALTDMLLIIQNEPLLAMLAEERSPPMNSENRFSATPRKISGFASCQSSLARTLQSCLN